MPKQQEDYALAFMYFWRALQDKTDGYPDPVSEYHFSKQIGRNHRFDWAWPEQRVAVEIDGGVWVQGGGRHAQDVDREKLNIASSLRWFVFRFSIQMLQKDPDACMDIVLNALDISMMT